MSLGPWNSVVESGISEGSNRRPSRGVDDGSEGFTRFFDGLAAGVGVFEELTGRFIAVESDENPRDVGVDGRLNMKVNSIFSHCFVS
jgi:hypothetical protein